MQGSAGGERLGLTMQPNRQLHELITQGYFCHDAVLVHCRAQTCVCVCAHEPYLELAFDVLEHRHWVWIGHSMGNDCRAKDLS